MAISLPNFLSIARHDNERGIEHTGGNLRFDFVEVEGTTFYLDLPKSKQVFRIFALTMVRAFVFSPFAENTYVLSDETREAVVVDPGCYTQAEKEELRDFIRKEGLTLKAILLTHAHLDHVFGAAYIARTFGVGIYMHPLEKPVLADFETRCKLWNIPGCEPVEAQHYFEEGDSFSFGNTKLDIIHVPGHAPGHVAFICAAKKWVVSGDCLFYRSIGRTDLPMGDYDTLIHSIRTRLFVLSDDYTVYAGHMQPTTIGEEKKLNPFLQS